MIQKLIIPGELTDLNTYINAERANKYAAAKIKHDDTHTVALYAKRLEHIDKPVDVHILWVTPNARKDKDNIAFAKKFILDGLMSADVIDNDGYNNIIGFKDEFAVDPRNPRIEVTLTYER